MGPIVRGLQRAESPQPRSLGPDSGARERPLWSTGKEAPERVPRVLGAASPWGALLGAVIELLAFSGFDFSLRKTEGEQFSRIY